MIRVINKSQPSIDFSKVRCHYRIAYQRQCTRHHIECISRSLTTVCSVLYIDKNLLSIPHIVDTPIMLQNNPYANQLLDVMYNYIEVIAATKIQGHSTVSYTYRSIGKKIYNRINSLQDGTFFFFPMLY